MNQSKYIEKLLSKFDMTDCKPKPTPCISGIDKVIGESESHELADPRISSSNIVGSLIYVITGTRSDLCYVVTKF